MGVGGSGKKGMNDLQHILEKTNCKPEVNGGNTTKTATERDVVHTYRKITFRYAGEVPGPQEGRSKEGVPREQSLERVEPSTGPEGGSSPGSS